MIKAIYYKEWIKTRIFFPLAFALSLGFTGYAILKLARVIKMRGVEHLWEILISRDVVFIENLQYLPLMMGLVLGIVQFIPEMLQKRLKLTLHLPYPRQKMILRMLSYGFVMLVAIFVIQYAILFFYLRSILAPELVSRILLTSAPWFVCGLSIYFLSAWICLEPTWKRKFINILISVGVVSIYFLSPIPQAYDTFIPLMVLFTVCSLFFPLLSVQRFKEGKQD